MIRKAEKKDIPRLIELLYQVDMVHYSGRPDIFKGPATKYDAEQLEALLADDTSPIFVYVDDEDIPLGHAFCVHKRHTKNRVLTDIKTLYIDDICVDEKVRGRHIGKALYDHIIGYAKANGFYNVTLNVWTFNPAAIKFYEAMGMAPQKLGMEKIL